MDTKIASTRATTWIVLCSVVAMLYFAREFLMPVAMAVFVAFAMAPLVRRLERIGLPRIAATIATVVVASAIAAGIGWILAGQVRDFAQKMPEYRSNVRAKAMDVRSTIGEVIQQANNTVRDLGQDLTGPAAAASAPHAAPVVAVPVAADPTPWGTVPDALSSMVEMGLVFALVFLLAFVILVSWEDLRDRMLALAGEHDLLIMSRAADEASSRVSLYLRRQMLVNGIHGCAMAVALWWIGVPNPLVWGLLGATLRFVPYLGPTIATLAPILVSFASSEGWEQTWITAGVLMGLEIITNNILEVKLYAACTGISPFALLVATAFWTWIWGPIGLVLATPLSVCMLVLGKRFPSLYFFDLLFREEHALPASSRLHHRMLANDSQEAWEILRVESSRSSFVETADRLLLPALGMAGVAHAENRIDSGAHARIGLLANELVAELEEQPSVEATHPRPGDLRVLCLPARDAFDSVGCRVLAHALGARGFNVSTVTPERLLSEVLEAVECGDYDAVIISSVLPTHFLHVRSLCKRLLALDVRVEILVGLWGEELPQDESRRRFPDSPQVHVVKSVERAVAWTDELATRADGIRGIAIPA